jgi:AcrR family transcriptional regulator
LQAEKILRVAARLFATHHFHEARMEDIAAAAEVGKGTLYRYFKDKDELYLALLQEAADQISCRLQAAHEQAVNPYAQLEGMVEAILDYFDKQPHLFDLIQHAEVVGRPDRENPWLKARRLSLDLFHETCAAGERLGLFHFEDRETAVLMLLGGLRAILRFGRQPRPEGLAGKVVQGWLQGHLHSSADLGPKSVYSA